MTNNAPWARATADLPAPLAVVDMDRFEANAHDLIQRAHPKPIRVASKSVRVTELLRRVLALPNVIGVMAFSLAEAIWLAEQNVSNNILVGYPTTSSPHLARLANDERLRDRITLMVDHPTHLERLTSLRREGATPFRVCIDVDASLKLGPIHIGVRRSPIRTPHQAAQLAGFAQEAGAHVWGVMLYEAQVAGVNERGLRAPLVRAMKRLSLTELTSRRREIVDAVEHAVGHAINVNGGGSGSVAETAADPHVTEVACGSGLYVPALFDDYRSFHPRPAAFFGLDVVRRPGRGYATVFGGGYVASGPPGKDRLPLPLRGSYVGAEAAGEVQTPLRFSPTNTPNIGDRVWFRHAKAGELMEHFATVHLVRSSHPQATHPEATVPTYRGQGFP